MKFSQKASIATRLFLNRIFAIRRPVMAGWAVTDRCNLRCMFCRWPSQESEELDTAAAQALIDDMAQSGVRLLVMSGGEPLLPALVARAKAGRMVAGVNTNGILIPDRIGELDRVDNFQLSLDGPEQVNDELRGTGAYAATIKALEVLKSRGRKVKLNTTVTRALAGNLDALLEIGRRYETPFMFHPVSTVHAGDIDLAGIRMPDEELHDLFGKLIEAKKAGRMILNSAAGLNRLRGVPKRLPPRCFAGRLTVNLTPAGGVVTCNQLRIGHEPIPATGDNFLSAVRSLPDPECETCWCANPMEMNLLLSFDPGTIWNAIFSKF